MIDFCLGDTRKKFKFLKTLIQAHSKTDARPVLRVLTSQMEKPLCLVSHPLQWATCMFNIWIVCYEYVLMTQSGTLIFLTKLVIKTKIIRKDTT